MRILILQDDFPPESFGGAGLVASAIAKATLAKGHPVYVLTTTQDKNKEGFIEFDGLKIFRIYSRYPEKWRAYLSLYNPQTVGKIKRIIEEIKPNIIHAHNIHFHLSFHSLKISKKSGAKVFLTAHDVMLFNYGKLEGLIDQNNSIFKNHFNYRVSWWRQIKKYKKRYNPLRNIIIKYYLAYVDKIFAVSNELKEALNQNNINNVEVVHNGINVEEWVANEYSLKKFRDKYNLNDKKVVLFGGRLSEAKGGYQAILSIKKVIQELPEAVLLILGERNSYADKMFDIAEDLGIGGNIIFTGWISGDELKSAYHSSDIVIMPSICFDTFGMTCLEAMSCKKPVIATYLGGAKEVVVDNQTGYIVNPLDVDMVSEKILDLLKDKTKIAKFGENGFERAKNLFSLDNVIKVNLKYYTNNNDHTPLLLDIFIKLYLNLRGLHLTELPLIKGLFYKIYSNIPNKIGTAVVRTINGQKLKIDLRDTIISTKILQYGYWEEGLTTFFKKNIKPGMVLLDIGAHIGYYTTLFSYLVGSNGKIYSFEPEPKNFTLLKENIKLNNANNCIVENKAVYNSDAKLKLNLDPYNSGAHTILGNNVNNFIEIDSIKLDEYFKNKNQHIDMIKMDVEGAEAFVLEGATKLINDNRSMNIVMEFGMSDASILKKIRSFGFSISIINHSTGEPSLFSNDEEILNEMHKKGYKVVNLLCSK